ncbi:MAG: electron transport complex subunit RsxC [Oscillospiraceae bacterium]|nr:electron transport complex subunit RsxC [Oscillospiraceae bacterium]
MNMRKKPLRGLFVSHRKHTRDMPTEMMPVPKTVSIIMSQHMGPPCDVLVKKGETVKAGQVIGGGDAYFSTPVHASVSGTVLKIDEIIMPNGDRSRAVIMEADPEQVFHESCKPPAVHDKAGFLEAVRASGLVGLGGAGFPTHVKLNPPNPGQVDTLLINAAECEPYITSDYRTMMEEPEDVLAGIKAIMKYIEIPRCVIGIEDNKPEAMQAMAELFRNDDSVNVCKLKSKYPQGAEKVLIYETTGRIVPEGKLPADVGVIVVNVTTAAALAAYLRTGVPLINKRVTVDGGAVTRKKNLLVSIGTPISAVLEYCGGAKGELKKVVYGGPMMGLAVYDLAYPVVKNCNSLLFFGPDEVKNYEETACIRCGRCAWACPINLMPLKIDDAFDREDMDGLRATKVSLCFECGCCAYVCPARRDLTHTNRLSKARLKAADAKENAKEGGKPDGTETDH